MSDVVVLRPLALASLALLSVAALPASLPASAQSYRGEPQYGAPYTPPRYAGARRPLDDTYRNPPATYGYPRAMPGIWNGLYVGGTFGFAFGDASPSGAFDTIDLKGNTLGMHVGYNWQIRDIVLGVEGDAAWSNVDGSRTFSGPAWVSANSDWLASIRGRVGYAANNVLLYATGGFAWADANVTVSDLIGSARSSETLTGYVLGGGIEWKFTQNVSARIEGLHYVFDDHKFNFNPGSLSIDSNVTTIRAGLTFHFN